MHQRSTLEHDGAVQIRSMLIFAIDPYRALRRHLETSDRSQERGLATPGSNRKEPVCTSFRPCRVMHISRFPEIIPLGKLVGDPGIEPGVGLPGGVTVRCRTLQHVAPKHAPRYEVVAGTA